MINMQMIAAMRQTATVALNCVATIQRDTNTDDGYGSKTKSMSTLYTNVPCRVQEIQRTPRAEVSTKSKQEYATTAIYFVWGTDCRSGDTVTIVNDKGYTDTFIIDSPYDNTVDSPTSNYYCYKRT